MKFETPRPSFFSIRGNRPSHQGASSVPGRGAPFADLTDRSVPPGGSSALVSVELDQVRQYAKSTVTLL